MGTKIKLSEAQFQKQVVDFLEKSEGWRTFHFEANFSEKKRRGFGEVGMPDLLCIRYWYRANYSGPHALYAQVLWIELKTPKGRPSAAQLAWHTLERKRGAITAIAGADFPADINGFMRWYRDRGLLRQT